MTRIIYIGLILIWCSNIGAIEIPKTSFSCEGRTTGYYADVTTGCQVYHMCDGLGRKFSYMCPNATLFQQRMMICDHWFMVNCSRSEENYDANLLIGQKGKAFIEDSTFSRTPRPDFLHPNEDDANIGFRKGQSQTQETKNLVGVVDETRPINTNTDDPSYFPPSHWSTEYPSHSTTQNPGQSFDQLPSKNQQPPRNNQQLPNRARQQSFNNQQPLNNNQQSFNNNQQSTILPQKYYKTSYNTVRKDNSEVSNDGGIDSANSRAKAIDFNSFNRNSNSFDSGIQKQTGKPFNLPSAKDQNVQVNFRSNFKATTPVYPTSVETTSVAPDDAGVLPPVNSVQENAKVNFRSNFKATTPNYPTSVETTSPDPGEAGLLPPGGAQTFNAENDSINEANHIQENPINTQFAPPKFEDLNRGTTLPPISEFFQPPKYTNSFEKTNNGAPVEFNIFSGNNLKSPPDWSLTMKPEQWRDLRDKLHIPDYDFPLDAATRPSYEGGFDSFQAKSEQKRESRKIQRAVNRDK